MTNNFLIHNFKHLTTTPENVEQLKKLVLQMAVQGKLTAKWREEVKTRFIASPELVQSPDYNARALLQKIKTEKQQLIKEGKIKRQKPLPPIADEEKPFELPEKWIWEKLGNLFTIKSGKRIHAIDYIKEGVPFLRSGEIGTLGRGEKITNPLYISEQKYDDIKKKFGVPKKGDILIACIGGSIGNTWKVDDRKFYYKDGNLVLIESINSLNTDYLHLYLKSHVFWSDTILNATDSSYNALTIVKLNNAVFPLPPFVEQQAIVSQVEKLFTQIDQLHALAQKRLSYREKSAKALFSKINHAENDTELQETWQTLTAHFHTLTQSKESLKQLRQSILQMAVQGKLTAKWRKENPDVEPASVLLEKIKAEKEQLIKTGKIKRQKSLPPISPEDKPFELPKNWAWSRLENLGVVNPRNKIDENIEISFFPMKNIHSNFNIKPIPEIRKWEQVKSNFTHLAENDVGIAKITPCFENSKSAIFKQLFNGFGAATTELHIFRSIIDELTPEYIYLILKSSYFIEKGKTKMRGVAGQKRVPTDFFKIFVVAVPPLPEQEAIVSKVKQLMSWCDELEKKIEKRDAYQEKMMQAVVKNVLTAD